nr:tRNA (guanosine(37)-N1)-methyltransferase TrmD [bacterium]
MLRLDVLTVFPGMFSGVIGESMMRLAQEKGLLEVHLHDIRAYTKDKHNRTDDYPFGGGAGLVMTAQPILDCVRAVQPQGGRRIYMSPRGRVLTHKMAVELSGEQNLLILCGHYEGVDQRALDAGGFEELSIGDYVLTGGELPAMVLIDAVARQIPGVLGCAESVEEESFSEGLLEYPQYTRPAVYEGMEVPDILLSGHHANIQKWRRQKMLEITLKNRPELLDTAPLTQADRRFLDEQMHQEARQVPGEE